MALVKCPDCRRNVSGAAPACPHCGRPMSAGAGRAGRRERAQVVTVEQTGKDIKLLRLVGMFVFLAGIAFSSVEGGAGIGGLMFFIAVAIWIWSGVAKWWKHD